jgi:hypothetical protein
MNSLDIKTKKSSKRKKTKIALFIAALSQAIIAVILFLIPPVIPDFVFAVLLGLLFLEIVLIIVFSVQNYNVGIAFLIMIITAIFFRRMRWPITGILFTIGFSGLACFSIIFAGIFFRKFKQNTFLRYIGYASCIVLSIVSIGLLWKNMHWPLAGLILSTGLVLFIPFLFAFVFTLPGSNYINWTGTERTIFFRVVIIPMAFVYILCMLMFVLPELWTAITRQLLPPFNMSDFELLGKPGIY